MKFKLNLYKNGNKPFKTIKGLTSWTCSTKAAEETEADHSITSVEMVDENGISSGLVRSESIVSLYSDYQDAVKSQRLKEEKEFKIMSFTDFVNESTKSQFIKIECNPSTVHNPYVDSVEGYLDKDSFITYGIYVESTESNDIGDEFMEYYSGPNYVPGSKKKSNSRFYTPEKIPTKYKELWNLLKHKYQNELKDQFK